MSYRKLLASIISLILRFCWQYDKSSLSVHSSHYLHCSAQLPYLWQTSHQYCLWTLSLYLFFGSRFLSLKFPVLLSLLGCRLISQSIILKLNSYSLVFQIYYLKSLIQHFLCLLISSLDRYSNCYCAYSISVIFDTSFTMSNHIHLYPNRASSLFVTFADAES